MTTRVVIVGAVPETFLDRLTSAGVRIGLAAATLVVGLIFAVIVRRLVRRFLKRDKVMRSIGPSMRGVIERSVWFFFLVLIAVAVLLVLGVSYRLVLIALAITGIILALALRQSLANFATTIVFLIFQPFRLGDEIETMGFRGIVEDIQLFNTVIKGFDHSVASFGNANIQDAGVINYSKSGLLWATVTLTVGYDQNLAQVNDLIREEVEADTRVLKHPPLEIVVTELTTDGVRIEVHPTVKYADWWPAFTELQEKIASRLHAAGIRLSVAPETQVRLLTSTPTEGKDG